MLNDPMLLKAIMRKQMVDYVRCTFSTPGMDFHENDQKSFSAFIYEDRIVTICPM